MDEGRFPTALAARSDAEILRLALRAHPHQPAIALWRATEFAMLRDETFAAPVLDLGCGTGEVARCVLRSHWPVDGLELVPSEARVAHASGIYRAVMRADGSSLPLVSATYGAVYSHSVLEHIPDDLGAVAEAARVLRPGGRLVFTVPTPAFAARIARESGADALASTNTRLGHYHYRALEEWTARLDELGLQVVTSRGHLPAATQRTWRRLDELMVRRVGGRRVLDWFRGLQRRRLVPLPIWIGLWSALLWRPLRRPVQEPGGTSHRGRAARVSELRVLHLSPTWFGDESVRGGGERYPLELASALLRRTPTRLVSFGDRPGTRRVDGFDIEVHRTWRRLRGRTYDAIGPGFVRALGWANVVHCHQARSGLTALAALIGRPLGKRIFVTDHGGGGVNWLRRLRIGRWIDAQLAQSEFAAATLPYVGRRAEVIYAGVDTAKYSPGSEKTVGRVVFVGRLLPHKGIETSIRGLPAGATLEIYGRPYDAAYLEFIRSEAVSRPVRIHTGASDDEVIAALRSACAFVMPSVYEDYRGRRQALPELVGLASLEAMACGTAAVVSDVAGMPEIIPPIGGAIVPPSDPDALRRALAPLTASVEQAGIQGAAAREHVVRRFTWSAVADRCLAAYTA